MKIEKPHTENFKKRIELVFAYLKNNNFVTRESVCNELGWDYNTTSDRRVREIISAIAQKHPLISTSDKKGYKLVKSIEDAEEVKHQWAELSSRQEEIGKRIPPLQKWLEERGINLTT